MMFDLIIQNAAICDGSGDPIRHGDLAVQSGRIAAIAPSLDGARETIDANGLVLAPGIIDSHTHYDAQITWDPGVAPSPSLGVTSVVIGNCGFTIAPCRPADRDLVMRNLTQVEGMSLDALRAGIRWDFQTYPEFLDQLETQGSVPNVASFLGHSSLRTWVLGAEATTRPATRNEIERMQQLVREAMAAGAVGFSTTTSESHNGAGGVPMPSRLATDDELSALVTAMGDSGRGVFMITKGANTSVAFLEAVSARSRRPVVVAALLHNSTVPEGVFDDLAAIASASERGNRMYGAVSACPLVFEFSLRSPYPLEGLAAWKAVAMAGPEQTAAVLAGTDLRQAIKDELSRPASVRLFNGEWQNLQVGTVALDSHRNFEGQSIATLATAAGKHPLDFMFDLALAENLETVFLGAILNWDESAVARLLLHPHSLVSLSDAGAHLNFLCDAGFGLHLLGFWCREKALFELPHAIRRLTAEPAACFGFIDRGLLRPGAWADLMLFDPAQVGRGPRRRAHDLPAGATRIDTAALGLRGVWVNGVRVVDEAGAIAGAGRPGQLLRRFNA